MKTDREIREAMDEQSRLNGTRKEGIEKENSRLRDIERVLKLLTKKFGTLNHVFKKKIKNMGSDNLKLLIENILDIDSLNEIVSLNLDMLW